MAHFANWLHLFGALFSARSDFLDPSFSTGVASSSLRLLAERALTGPLVDAWTMPILWLCSTALPSTRTTSLSPRESQNSNSCFGFFFLLCFFLIPPSLHPLSWMCTYNPFSPIFYPKAIPTDVEATRERLTCGGGWPDFPENWKCTCTVHMYLSIHMHKLPVAW